MPVVRVGLEQDLAALVRSATAKRTSRAARQRLETEVLRLNAGLDPAQLVPGGIVAFPDSTDLLKDAAEPEPGGLLATVAKQVAAWEAAVSTADEQARTERTAMGRTARSKALRDLVGTDRDVLARLDSIAAKTTAANAAARADSRRRPARVARWTDDLAALRRPPH